jgi:RNA-binding protein 39
MDADDLEIERLLEEFENKAAAPVKSQASTSSSSRSSKHHHSHKKRRHSHSSDSDSNSNRKSKKNIQPPSSSSSSSRDLDHSLKKISRTTNNNNPPPHREHTPELTPEERDGRTILCMQLAARISPRDLEEFFTKANIGKVRDVRLITDPRTKRSKGVAYVEFRDLDTIPKAIALSGQKLLGIPVIIKASNAEKNRQAAAAAAATSQLLTPQSTIQMHGAMKLYIGSLHFNITDEMLKGIFEPFGRVDMITLMKDPGTGRSRGYGFVQFAHGEDAKRAMENLNGFELAGRPMKVGYVSDKQNE